MSENEPLEVGSTVLANRMRGSQENKVLPIHLAPPLGIPKSSSLPEVVLLGKFKGLYDMRHVHCCNYINHFPKEVVDKGQIQQEMRKRCQFCRHLPYVSSGLRYTVDTKLCGFSLSARNRDPADGPFAHNNDPRDSLPSALANTHSQLDPKELSVSFDESFPSHHTTKAGVLGSFGREALPLFKSVGTESLETEPSKAMGWQWGRPDSISKAISLFTRLTIKLCARTSGGSDSITSL